ncbi:alanine racemase [Desulfobacterium sp. N47]|uniref:Alanine racemase n=1 Tax=uncultured Desulfobacterium sp. TaxID=201089 RepID=E1YD13_9BACT|nr:Alanine racemase [uncultured Desulfobacterium sp.]
MADNIIWAEIDLKAIAHNLSELRRIINPDSRLMAVVKANAYGHGSVEVARCALDNGAEYLGVARIEEAMLLRKNNIDAPILIFGFTQPDSYENILKYNLVQTVCSYAFAESLSSFAISKNQKIKVHIKIDTGMGRIGVLPDCFRNYNKNGIKPVSALAEVESIASLSGIEAEGIYTHFSMADSYDKSFTTKQFEIFMEFISNLKLKGIEFKLKHAANSAAIIDIPKTHLDMVRAGISMYGLYPSEEVNKDRVSLLPAMSLKAIVTQVKNVSCGFNVSYGATYKTTAPTTIATVPVGYADGYSRLLSSRGHMLVHGQKAPIAGRVCMDLTMLDVGSITEVKQGDEVVVFGKQNGSCVTVDEIATLINTINYEIVTLISERVKRVYLK